MIEPILRELGHPADMSETLHIDLDALMSEIARYLAAVDAFRAAGREPTWLPETAPLPGECERTAPRPRSLSAS